MSRNVTVIRSAGATIPEDYLGRLVKKNRTYIGAAAAMDGKITVAKINKPASLEVFKELTDTFLQSTMMFSLGDDKIVLEEDMMPYNVIVAKDGNILAVVSLDGSFDRHKKTSNSHVAEYQVAHDYLKPRLQRWFDAGGFESVHKELNDDLNKQDICNLWAKVGAISILFADGSAKTISYFEDTAAERSFSWGYASDPYGFKEEKPREQVEPPKKDSLAERMKAAVGITGKEPVPQGAAAVSNAVVLPKADTAVQVQSTSGLPAGATVEKPDLKVYDTREKMGKYYETRLGHKPHGFMSGRALVKYPDPAKPGEFKYELADTNTLKNLSSLMNPDTATSGTAVRELGGSQTKTLSLPQKDTGTHYIQDAKAPEPAKVVSGDLINIISPEVKDRLKNVFQKSEYVGIFNEAYQAAPDPKALRQQMEEDLPPLPLAMGWGQDMSFFDGFNKPMVQLLVKGMLASGKPHDALTKLVMDLIHYAVRCKLGIVVDASGKQRARM